MSRTPRRARQHGFRYAGIDLGCAFEYGVHVIVGPYANVVPFMRLYYDDKNFVLAGDTPRGQIHVQPGLWPVVWLPRVPRTAEEMGTLAHEMLHATIAMADWSSIKLDGGSEEVFCHVLGNLVRQALKQLRRKNG